VKKFNCAENREQFNFVEDHGRFVLEYCAEKFRYCKQRNCVKKGERFEGGEDVSSGSDLSGQWLLVVVRE
jgi:hypothetical protein